MLDAALVQAAAVYVRGLVESMVRRQAVAGLLPPATANHRVMGVKLTLHRAGRPWRMAIKYASASQWELDHSLGYLLGYLASSISAAAAGQPALKADDLPYLGLTLTLMLDAREVQEQHEARLQVIDPLTHGVLLEHPAGSAVVFPEPGSDWPMDASRYLDHCCRQANLPADAWRRDPQTKLVTFLIQEAELEPELTELSWLSLNGLRINTLASIATRAMDADASMHARLAGDALLDQVNTTMTVVRIVTSGGQISWAAGKGRSLASLAHMAGLLIRSQLQTGESHAITQLAVYAQAARLSAVTDEKLAAQAYCIDGPGQMVLITDASTAGEALLQAGGTWSDWHAGDVTVWSLVGRSHDVRLRMPPRRKPSR